MTDALREKLIHAGRVLVDEGQGDYVWGHISVRLPDGSGRFLMKPGCIGLEELTQDNIITCDIEGERVAGTWPRHNEVYIHSEVMRARPDINAVVHTHPEYAVAFSSLGRPLAAISNDGTMFSAGVPIFSETTDLITDQPRGRAVAKSLGSGNVLILRNHGIVAAGRSIE
jgi:L-fuculose-phosphate aldolase